MQTTEARTPPMDPNTSEADEVQLQHAVRQGDAYKDALAYMAEHVAKTGGVRPAGDYLVGYAIEDAGGMYVWTGGALEWRNPQVGNAHVEIAVCDGADGRFVPDLHITVELVAPDGSSLGPYEHPLMWHPMLYHYARDWDLPADGAYTLRIHIDPPHFLRHDEVNGRRYLEPVEVEIAGVRMRRGKEPVDPPGETAP